MTDHIISKRMEEREIRIKAILVEVQKELARVLDDDTSNEWRKAIADEIVGHSKVVLDAASYSELESESALDRHLEDVAVTARHLLNLKTAQHRLRPG